MHCIIRCVWCVVCMCGWFVFVRSTGTECETRAEPWFRMQRGSCCLPAASFFFFFKPRLDLWLERLDLRDLRLLRDCVTSQVTPLLRCAVVFWSCHLSRLRNLGISDGCSDPPPIPPTHISTLVFFLCYYTYTNRPSSVLALNAVHITWNTSRNIFVFCSRRRHRENSWIELF